ncbi:MAG: nucleoside triphosphate pyrophosphohydrolase [Bacteroidota bacterium]
MNEKLKEFGKLLEIMDELREKCPWDKAQTLESIRNLTIEETYELADAIMKRDMDEIKKELGDLMLHIVFYSKIGSETSDFDILDVLKAINQKLIYRHPHVFENVKVNNQEDVKKNWEELKMSEGKKSVLSGVPASLPALVKANRVQEKVRAVGFDWEQREQVWEKIEEEMNELKEEISNMSKEKTEAEFGDLFFSLVNAARLYDIDPETALERTNLKFIKRFKYLESKTIKQGKSLKEMSLVEMNEIWEEAKKFDLQK